jgi:hypothetical protein
MSFQMWVVRRNPDYSSFIVVSDLVVAFQILENSFSLQLAHTWIILMGVRIVYANMISKRNRTDMPTTVRYKDDRPPTLETLLMIEKAIKKADLPPKRTELWKSLSKKMTYQTFEKALDYLDASGKIAIDRDNRVVWVAVDNPELQKLLDSGVTI